MVILLEYFFFVMTVLPVLCRNTLNVGVTHVKKQKALAWTYFSCHLTVYGITSVLNFYFDVKDFSELKNKMIVTGSGTLFHIKLYVNYRLL